MADAQASGACIRKDVRVQVPPRPLDEVLLDPSEIDPAPPTSSALTGSPHDTSATPDTDVSAPPESDVGDPGDPSDDFGRHLIPAIAKTATSLTSRRMTNNGLALKHQSDTLVANIRGRHARFAVTGATSVTLADILPLVAPAPVLDVAPTTRAIGPTGRIRVCVGGETLSSLLGWVPGPLVSARDGAWIVLRPDVSGRKLRRNDGHCSFLDDQRLRITEALTTNLGLAFGDEVALLVLREQGALALTSPSRLLCGAPLALLDNATATRELVSQ